VLRGSIPSRSFRNKREREVDRQQYRVPALIEFPAADGIRILASIVDTPLAVIRIGAELTLGWSQAVNAMVPVFSIPQ
jgi:hypothetical protein